MPKIKKWLKKRHDQPTFSRTKIVATEQLPSAIAQFEVVAEQHMVPYDENLLERSRTQWQFGDWASLTQLARDTLQHHPDRAKLALLAAAGHLQQGNSSEARLFTRLAQEWGCSKKLISQILISGVHNTLGRTAAISNQQDRALQHFESAINIGVPGSDMRLITQARVSEQYSQIKLANQLQMADLEVNRSIKLNHQNTEAEIKALEVEKNFVSLLKKEKIRLHKIIENTQSISGLKQPLQYKTFCIGSNKTGTTSIDSAMRTLGFTTMPEDLAYQYLTLGRDEKTQEDTFRRLLKTEAGIFNFFEDLPFCYKNNYKIIDECYPDANFILSIRDPVDWFESCIRWIKKLDLEAVYNWIWGIRFVIENKNEIIDCYSKRNIEIQDYFSGKPEKLLIIQIEKATFLDLSVFLSLDSGSAAALVFPKENVNDLKN
jgi:hypothetical protein